jgi:hypothetical protein
MNQNWRLRFLVCLVMATFPLCIDIAAQVADAELQGTVTDEGGGVLPGVTITVTHVETGTSRPVITNERGRYLLRGLRVGRYLVTAELPGFATVTRENLNLLLGQSTTLDLVMTVAALQETVTVSGESPLVDTTRSTIGSNLDLQQMQDLPLNGRQWLGMTFVAPGVRSSTEGLPSSGAQGAIRTKINVDGLQTNQSTNFNAVNIDFSQEAVREVQVLTNRFSAEYARAAGGVVNAVTKSGTNAFAGSFYGFFRNDKFNATDWFTGRVEPFEDNQIGTTFGGPLRRDRLHFFVNWESERRPQTQTSRTGIGAIDSTFPIDFTKDMGLARVDYQLTTAHRMGLRYAYTKTQQTNENVVDHPSNGWTYPTEGNSIHLSSTWSITQNVLNEVKAQYLKFAWNRKPNSPFPRLDFPAADLGVANNALSDKNERFIQVRDDLSWFTSSRWGEHSVKTGFEFFHENVYGAFGDNWFGDYLFSRNPTDWGAVVDVVEANDRNGLQRLVDSGVVPTPTRALFAIGDPTYSTPVSLVGGYIQDDWKPTGRLTLNLGLRYDIEFGAFLTDFTSRYIQTPREHGDNNNWAPRFGFAYDISGNATTVIRGGGGRYFDQIHQNIILGQRVFNGDTFAQVNVLYNQRPDFMINPLSGITIASVVAGTPSDIRPMSRDLETPYSDQLSIGVAHELTDSLALQADYIHIEGRKEMYTRDVNLFTNPATGDPLPVVTFGRPDRRFAAIREVQSDGRSRYDGLQVAATKRFSNRHQYQASYILSRSYADSGQTHTYTTPEPTRPISDLYGPSERDQRHRFVVNGSVQVPLDVRLSGIVYAASGIRYLTLAGRDLNGDLANNDLARDPDGTKWPRAGAMTDPVLRVDLRVSRQFRLVRSIAVEGIAEVFNLFNRRNYISYNGTQTSSTFLQPRRSADLNYQPRMAQFGFRLTF